VFSPIARHETIRLVITITTRNGWHIYHLDVKSAFLDGTLEETVYVTQPPGFIIKGKEYSLFRLNKALYGSKQAPRAWNKRIDKFFVEKGFKKCLAEHEVYAKGNEGTSLLIICLYVDDLMLTGSNIQDIEDFKSVMKYEFEMTDLGKLAYFLGMEILRT